eukprot:5706609-Pleurochrysis_carterae.AAC.1
MAHSVHRAVARIASGCRARSSAAGALVRNQEKNPHALPSSARASARASVRAIVRHRSGRAARRSSRRSRARPTAPIPRPRRASALSSRLPTPPPSARVTVRAAHALLALWPLLRRGCLDDHARPHPRALRTRVRKQPFLAIALMLRARKSAAQSYGTEWRHSSGAGCCVSECTPRRESLSSPDASPRATSRPLSDCCLRPSLAAPDQPK